MKIDQKMSKQGSLVIDHLALIGQKFKVHCKIVLLVVVVCGVVCGVRLKID